MTRRTPPHLPHLAALALAAVTLTACDGGGDGAGEETAAPPSADERLDQAHDVLADAGSLQLQLTGSDLPEDQSTYIISAAGAGTMDPPAFDGTITAKMSGIQADVPTVAVDGDLWVKLPFAPQHVRTDPAELGVPDPADLLDRESGLVSLLEATEDPQFGDRRREGAETVQEVAGTLPGQVVRSLLRAGDEEADFDVVYGLAEDTWQVRTIVITGPYYPPAVSTYTVTLTGYGDPVTVTAP